MIPTKRERSVYRFLVYDGPRFARTQSETARILKMPKSTVSDIARSLEKKKYIKRYKGSGGSPIYYSKAINSNVIDAYVEMDLRCDRKRNDEVDAMRYIPVARAHPNGGWITVNVINRGEMDTYECPASVGPDPSKNGTRTYRQTLFGQRPPAMLKGLLSWNTKLFFESEWHTIRYQVSTASERRSFGVVPRSQYIVPTDLKKGGDVEERFVMSVAPLLRHLEKYAGWIFEKDGNGNYATKSKFRTEYGCDGIISSAIKDVAGDIGIVGSNLWNDRSGTAIGDDGEFETNQADYIEAINRLPSIDRASARHEAVLRDHEKRIRDLEGNA